MRFSDLIDWPRCFLPEDPSRPVTVSLANGSEREQLARDQLLRLLDTYDLKRWQCTNRVRIEHGVIPHSHPVLTLNTRYLDDDGLALSTYLHEQVHWFLWRRNPATRRAIADLRKRFPAAGYKPDYLHYVVCYLEYWSMIEVVGPDEARRVIEFWGGDHYRETYAAVLSDFEEIGKVVAGQGLVL